ncbi:M20/M25/M40 family metallo-hydrolase [Acidianus manzaensis]|uniref:Acetylornithine deacetylase n=1 Tax=Acidianus manzaensis TaxID=282676 RepID=A0A1W6K0K0_9CREN|nr:M20/M25/M40 family metallo-hydrolase [Acidianus manzaensis]ARM76039.1 acetylornithine deacetylase [Acidianus manzaensis]
MDYLDDLFEFLKIDTTSAKGKGEEGAKYLVDYMKSNGIDARLIRDKSRNPYVYGEINVKANKTLLVYNHYDVQPVEPLDKWNSDPFKPKEKDGKIFARGVGDDKGTLMARLQKIISLYKENKLKINIKFIYEGEEEIGSPNIVSFLNNYRDLLKSNYILWEGSGRGPDGSPEIVLGVKGLLYVELRASTEKDLHSMYAPIVQNPVWKLVYFINNLRDQSGKVKIEGFYDDVKWLTEEETRYLKADKEEMEKALGQNVPDNFMKKLVEEPTCNIAGIFGGYTGEGSKTVIPSYAFVKIDFRLVPNQDPEKILTKLKSIADKENIEVVVYGKVKPYRTSISSEISKALIQSAKEVYKIDPVVLPNSPGTGPMESFANILNNNQVADGIGVDNAGSNIHSFNENIFKDDYFKAMDWLQSFLEKIS